jgi:hypothetical protein
METMVNLDRVRPERVAGYGTNFVGEGWVERMNGSPVREHVLRATVALGDDEARRAMTWTLENHHAFPYSFTDANRIIGVELVEGQPARI